MAIIGGGFCGTLVAAQLARRGAARAVLIERRACAGRGLAYTTPSDALLLNVPAGRMSAFPERPDDFTGWLGAGRETEDVDAGAFVSRSLYGDYLEAILAAAAAGGRIDVAHGEAVDVEPTATGVQITLAGGRTLAAAAVVFALGNAPPRPIPGLAGVADRAAVVADPLGDGARLSPRPDDTVTLVGSGLTALDVVAWLRAGGHRGRIVLVSRHGLVPGRHAPARQVESPEIGGRPTIARLLAGLRARGEANVDPLRPLVAAVWRRMDRAERRRFLRHVRPFWDIHRHRAPPATHEVVERGRAEGWLEVRAARIVGGTTAGAGPFRLVLRARGDVQTSTLETAWIVNCTGPERDVRRQASPLVAALRRRGLLVPDALGLGVTTGPAGELISALGKPAPRMFALGAWRVADLWESTAVPELRQQAADLAERLSIELTRCSRAALAALPPI